MSARSCDADAETLRRSFECSRLRARWLAVQCCMFEPMATLTPARREKVARICNRLAARIDAINPWPDFGPEPRLGGISTTERQVAA